MINLFFKIKPQYILVLIFITLTSFQSTQKTNGSIFLADEKLQIIPKEFYISNVIDERADRTASTWLIPAITVKDVQPKAYPVDLQGGALNAIKQFIDHNLPQNKTLRPVIISLKKLSIKETALTGSRVEGRISLIFSFSIYKDEDEPMHLAEYNGTTVYERDATQTQSIEPALRHLLINGLTYVNNWMNSQAETNIKLARGVKVIFTDYDEKTEGDSIYYKINRPITWADFQSGVPNSKYEAEVFPTLGYDEHTEIVKGIINLHLSIKACLPKSAAWAKEGNRNDYTLNHEQRHFDIVKIAAEHFKKKIKAINLPPGNYDGPINKAYLNAYREMNNLQIQYDTETHHGTNVTEQQRWNRRIDKELKELGVKQ